ncbi:MAG TPA: hypothetical protein VKH81_16470 [Candidatus Angelobacter sp.]|nr:hypothetical protein [Candidatus Angelobacter sp.]
MNDVPTEWNLRYEAWIIGDGEPHRSVGDIFDWFTVEFWSHEGLVNTAEKSKSAIALPEFEYRVCAEVIYLSEEDCVLDFGIWAGGYRSNLPVSCQQGNYVSGKIGLGLPAIALAPDEFLKGYQWRVNRIFADLTPDSAETSMPDGSRARYRNVDSTKSVGAQSYILHCSEIGFPHLKTPV